MANVAILSDIHGVLPALEAVLEEPAVKQADQLVLTGDIAAGPQPVETLDRLEALGDRVVWVRGNADRELVQAARGGATSIPDAIAGWAGQQLRSDQVERLDKSAEQVTLDLEGFGKVRFCHATPRNDEEVVLVDSRLDRWTEVFQDLDDDIRTIVCGHTHMPFLRLAHGRLVVNPGSIGMPYGQPGAHWALLGDRGAVTLRRTEYDYDAACERIAKDSAYPQAAAWADEYVRARNSDADAIIAFGPRDGRT
ncbi:metallophosphoesterase family protein [Tenggerimyces flavus]|uniref:Phosphoesterase n=1 Tax=Tenggerimyces flavus TaxID=1708749 RepID=A0ABV7YJR6_9ACTN|nr:metallophosphoesterase family protein [Tenggerimyces flavus]MBM7784845.1 putative phosphoesterase [Tenggerimyces flavus]